MGRKHLLICAFLLLPVFIFAMGGTVPAGLPGVFGFGSMEYADTGYKAGQGGACWDYSYCYITPGWRTWGGSDPSYPARTAQYFEGLGLNQVITWYYTPYTLSNYNSTTFMTTYFNDMKFFFQQMNTYASKKVIMHIEPDLIGFFTSNNYTATQTGVCKVGSTGIPEIASLPDTIRGWSQAIYTLRNLYAPNKVLLAHHISGWCYGTDIMATSMDEATMTTHVANITNFITSMENGNRFDLFVIDPADRDADWSRMTQGDATKWYDMSHTYTNTRSYGKLGAFADKVSTNLGRRGFFWQIPVGNTYYKTCNNTTGHYRDNKVQAFIPSLSPNGSSGTPGDAYSNTVTSAGPVYWANRGIIAVLFGPGDTGCTHPWDNRADGTTNPASDSGTGGPAQDVWGQAVSAYTDDDGGYLRLAVAKYCSKGKFSFYTPTFTVTGTPPTATRTPTITPTVVVCSKVNYDGETAATNLSSGAFWISATDAVEVTYTAHTGSKSLAIHCTWTSGYWGGGGWNWANWNASGDVFNASTYDTVDFWMRTSSGTNSNISVALVDSAATASNSVNIGAVTQDWQKFSIPLSSFTGANMASLWELSINFGGTVSGDVTVFFDDFAFANDCTTPSPTITGTPPTYTRTPTPTATFVVCNSISYDGETWETNMASGGAWAAPTGSTATEVTYTAHAGTKSLEFALTWTSSWAGGGWNWASYNEAKAIDMSQVVNVDFWIKTDTNSPYTFSVDLVDNTGNASASYQLTSVTATWQRYTIPMSYFTGIDLTKVMQFSVSVGGATTGSVRIYIDDLVFITRDCSTATPTASRTSTPTPTFSATPPASPTATGTRTVTVTPTPTATLTALLSTPSFTATATMSQTPAFTATIDISPSFTPTRSATVTFTDTASPTYTRTPTATFTVTLSPTGSFTATGTPTFSATPTGTATRTYTVTVSPTATVTPTHSVSPTITETVTGTPPTWTFTPTVTETMTSTPTYTVTQTFTATPTATASQTYTGTGTASPTTVITATFTATEQDSPTATWTTVIPATATRTMTATDTAQPTQSATEIDTPLPGATATDTPQPAMTYTQLPTESSTPQPTLSHTAQPTGTHTDTATPDFTRTATPANTQTPAPTQPPTQTYTPTGYASAVPTPTFTATQTVAVTVAATPGSQSVTEVTAYPNPVDAVDGTSLRIACTIARQDADSIYVKIYSPGYRLVRQYTIYNSAEVSLNIGRKYLEYPIESLRTLARGTYFYQVTVKKGNTETRSKVEKLVIMR